MARVCCACSLSHSITGNCDAAPVWIAISLFCRNGATVSGVKSCNHRGLNVTAAMEGTVWLFTAPGGSRGGSRVSGTPVREKAPASPPPPEGGGGFCGGFPGGGGGTSGWPPSVRGLCGGGWSESISIFSSWFVGSCSLLVLRDMMMKKKNLSWLIS